MNYTPYLKAASAINNSYNEEANVPDTYIHFKKSLFNRSHWSCLTDFFEQLLLRKQHIISK